MAPKKEGRNFNCINIPLWEKGIDSLCFDSVCGMPCMIVVIFTLFHFGFWVCLYVVFSV